ncbi:Aldehyde Dehydrogenase (plasmid) [Rhizobium leguminosarum bv. trifolii WSM2304]|uniref:Aldehyde Dehydrogenase n=1 Tax=Rhizobium leguminosarum bv. trifolii (strain WSM2304) TaxID=395492 RepID=A0ABF7QZD4_RHILW|nr:aldehyde dehydrogenase family protein [Rhizobium leguminosarum]ACI59500.1 Aldehyde Dehydrogenase [Rhizobium leguminosarum bv. trifolii WSM2304]
MADIIEIFSPFDTSRIGQVAAASPVEIERALETAYALFRDRRQWLSKQKRIEILKRAAAIITQRREELARQAASEGGKPLRDSLIEVDRGVDGIHTCVEELRTKAGQVVPMDLNATSAGRVAFTQYEPIGVVVGVSAFNHPFNLVVHQLAPAVAVGAPVILKPATTTPLSCRSLVEIFREAGLPEGWAQMVVPETNELATRLVTDPRVGFFSFIGSAAVGWSLRSKIAPGTRCALEHGGVAPVIVSHDADLDMAMPKVARGAFWHAGQACVGVQRVFCHNSVVDDVAERLGALGERMVIGDPLSMATEVGPLISRKELERVGRWVDDAASGGAKLISGGKRISESCYSNTVLLNPRPDSDVMLKEVFGPVVCVYGYDDIDSAISLSNSLPYSFQAAVFTSRLDTAMHCYRHLDGTAIMVNENTLFRVDWMPFSGARQSGHGVGGMPYTMHEMQTEKMMVWRSDALA